jgi:hypothetical protein
MERKVSKVVLYTPEIQKVYLKRAFIRARTPHICRSCSIYKNTILQWLHKALNVTRH